MRAFSRLPVGGGHLQPQLSKKDSGLCGDLLASLVSGGDVLASWISGAQQRAPIRGEGLQEEESYSSNHTAMLDAIRHVKQSMPRAACHVWEAMQEPWPVLHVKSRRH